MVSGVSCEPPGGSSGIVELDLRGGHIVVAVPARTKAEHGEPQLSYQLLRTFYLVLVHNICM